MPKRPHLKNGTVKLLETLEAGTAYSASAWIQTRDNHSKPMSEEQLEQANYIQTKMLEFGFEISISFQEKTDGYPRKGNMMLFTEDPNRQVGSFQKPKVDF